jgi:hypothetical protein
MKKLATKMIIFKATEKQVDIIERLTEKLHLVNKSECIRQVLLERADKEGIKV